MCPKISSKLTCVSYHFMFINISESSSVKKNIACEKNVMTKEEKKQTFHLNICFHDTIDQKKEKRKFLFFARYISLKNIIFLIILNISITSD